MSGTTIGENLASVMHRIERAARKAGRDPGEITLVSVTKNVETKKIKEAMRAGARVFGENYVQEAEEKIENLKKARLSWHFIGHLQKNKAKYAVELFDMIESVDSVELAKELSKKAKKPVDVLIEVNIAREKTKTGVEAKNVEKVAREIAGLENLRLKGLMAIPPCHENPEMSRPYFITLRRIAERINKESIPGVSMNVLSMGMSDDFEVAIEEGATVVRVGRAIFGEREPGKTAVKTVGKN
ncbi:MAG: YggS family pyridoxal phosphate-dependent enzyme [Deltaproteobacteria bacterium]|nr:YggS family pyridoxal phosphate-dependent enzyme [Deltaproteobacteria bacterium]